MAQKFFWVSQTPLSKISFHMIKQHKEGRRRGILETVLYLCTNRKKYRNYFQKSIKWEIEISTVIDVSDYFLAKEKNEIFVQRLCGTKKSKGECHEQGIISEKIFNLIMLEVNIHTCGRFCQIKLWIMKKNHAKAFRKREIEMSSDPILNEQQQTNSRLNFNVEPFMHEKVFIDFIRLEFHYRSLCFAIESFKINLKLRTRLNSSEFSIASLSASVERTSNAFSFHLHISPASEVSEKFMRDCCRFELQIEMNIFPFSIKSHNLCIPMWEKRLSWALSPFGANKIKFRQIFGDNESFSLLLVAMNDSIS